LACRPNIFYGTSIPACILVFKKCREHPEDILFIDASGDEYFEKGTNQNRPAEEDIERIVTPTGTGRQKKFSYVAPLEEVKENDYNLNIPATWTPLRRKNRLTWPPGGASRRSKDGCQRYGFRSLVGSGKRKHWEK
jgi:type I restriction-modification system DNA methylase subunit